MGRNITVTFGDGTSHTYQNAPDDITPDAVQARAEKEFSKPVKSLDGGAKTAQASQPTSLAPEASQKEINRQYVIDRAKSISKPFDGLVSGFADLGNTLINGAVGAGEFVKNKLTSPNLMDLATGSRAKSDIAKWNDERNASLDDYNKANDSTGFKLGRVGGNVIATAPVGGVLGKVAGSLGASAPVVNALTSGGMSSTASAIPRALAGGTVGAAQVALVDPSVKDSVIGFGIGAVTPSVLKLAGMAGTSVYNAVKGNKPGAGKLLADALGVDEPGLQNIIRAANAAPESIVPGSKLTLSQALQTQGANIPQVKMLNRVVSEGPGGDALLKRAADQGQARLNALIEQGAQTYQGAAREEATQGGNLIGSVLRTQAGDDKAAARAAWEAVYGRAGQEGVALHLPLDAMDAATSPLGAGSVGIGKDARNVMNVANQIGTQTVDAVKPMSTKGMQDLVLAVRSAGGINTTSKSGKELSGEIRNLREAGLNNIVRPNTGQSVERMAEKMHEAGFLPDDDPATLLNLLHESASGNRVYSAGSADDAYRAAAEAAQGMPPGAQKFNIPVPFDQFQRLRRDSGALAAKLGERAGGATEAGVLNEFQRLLTAKVDDAATGNLLHGEVMPQGFREQYNAARGMTKANAERYKGGNNITSILRKPTGQDYTLTGDEITNKLWHGGAGLGGDVANLKNVLSDANREPVMNALQKIIMTDAASKTKASGDFGAALPKYVESRMPGLNEAMTPDQLNALTSVAADIRNADAATAVSGLTGSDSYAKISRAMDAGILDSPIAKTLSKIVSVKGIGAETVRNKLADLVMQNKGKTIAALLADPKAAAQALQNRAFVQALDDKTVGMLKMTVARGAPILATY